MSVSIQVSLSNAYLFTPEITHIQQMFTLHSHSNKNPVVYGLCVQYLTQLKYFSVCKPFPTVLWYCCRTFFFYIMSVPVSASTFAVSSNITILCVFPHTLWYPVTSTETCVDVSFQHLRVCVSARVVPVLTHDAPFNVLYLDMTFID